MADEKELRETLREIFLHLKEVRVVTVVGDVTVAVSTDESKTIKTTVTPAPGETKALITVFDLIDGDVTNVISPELLDNSALRAFHSEQVERSIKVLPDHVRAITTVFEKLF
jgi:hypothetical protein